MASTPSASALSAVLRCRGKIWTRNPSAKRPAPAAYGLGLAGAALREPSAEPGGSSSVAARRLFPPGERGGLLSVACRWVTRDTFTQDSEKLNKLLSPKLSSGSARAAAPRGQHSHVRKTTSHLPGKERCSKISSVLPLELVTYVPRRVLKVTVTSPWSMGSTAPGWKKLRSACVTLTALLVSRLSGLCAWSRAHPQVKGQSQAPAPQDRPD